METSYDYRRAFNALMRELDKIKDLNELTEFYKDHSDNMCRYLAELSDKLADELAFFEHFKTSYESCGYSHLTELDAQINDSTDKIIQKIVSLSESSREFSRDLISTLNQVESRNNNIEQNALKILECQKKSDTVFEDFIKRDAGHFHQLVAKFESIEKQTYYINAGIDEIKRLSTRTVAGIEDAISKLAGVYRQLTSISQKIQSHELRISNVINNLSVITQRQKEQDTKIDSLEQQISKLSLISKISAGGVLAIIGLLCWILCLML